MSENDLASNGEKRLCRELFAGRLPTPQVIASEAKLVAHLILRCVTLGGPEGIQRSAIKHDLAVLGIPPLWAAAMISRAVMGGWFEPVSVRGKPGYRFTQTGRSAAEYALRPKLPDEGVSRRVPKKKTKRIS